TYTAIAVMGADELAPATTFIGLLTVELLVGELTLTLAAHDPANAEISPSTIKEILFMGSCSLGELANGAETIHPSTLIQRSIALDSIIYGLGTNRVLGSLGLRKPFVTAPIRLIAPAATTYPELIRLLAPEWLLY